MERLPRSVDPGEDGAGRAAAARRLLIAAGVHDEIWQALPADHGHDNAVHDRMLGALETRLHDAGAGEGRVLDIGCGDGTFAARLAAQHGARVTGVDPSPAALERARAAHPGLDWLAPTVDGALPLADASFDVVVCVYVLEHVADTQSLMSEARRVLVRGGLLAVAVPFHGRTRNMMTALRGFERHFDPLEPVLRFYTARSLRALLLDFGFERVEVHARGGFPLLRETLVALARRP